MNINQAASNLYSGAVSAFDRLCNHNNVNSLTYTVGLCPIADKFSQFDIVRLINSGLTVDVKVLTEQSQRSSYDIYDRSNGGDSFRYGIKGGLKCERREWFGNGDSQFDTLTPTDKGFELSRRYDICKETLNLKCTADKLRLHCKATAYLNDMTVNYEVNENKVSTRERLCLDKKCERSTTTKNKIPLLLNKLLDLTNKV